MEEYKRINTELVKEVCRMRGVIAEQERMIIELQSQLGEKHSQRVEQQRRLVALMTENFKQAVRTVNPDTTILRLLTTPENMKPEKRRSSQSIARKSRDSIPMARRCVSALPLSPVRRSARFESPEPYGDGDCDAKDMSVAPVQPPASDQLRIIVEAPEEISVESRSITPVNAPSFLHDTTSESSPHVVVQRGKRRNLPRACEPDCLQDITLTSQQECHIDETNPTCSRTTMLIPPQDKMSPSLSPTGSIFGGNADFHTSTPRPSLKVAVVRLSKTAPKPKTDDSCVTSSSRPQRSCKPLNLKEPDFDTELRAPSPRSSKKKRKSKR